MSNPVPAKKRLCWLLTVSALSIAAAAPIMAQDAMMKDNMASART